MSAETQKYVDSLLLQFRELVIDIQEEQRELLEKLNEFPEPLTLASTLPNSNVAKVSHANGNSTTSNTNSKTTTNSGSVSPPSEDPNSNSNSTGLSSSIATTDGSNRPPSYKTAIKPVDQQQVPKAPLRAKRRSATLATTTVSPHHRSLANAAAAAALSRISRISSGFNTISPPANTMRGALIVLEGLDRVGKSTLAKKLVEHLQRIDKPVATCRFPDRSTKVGQLIDDLLKNTSKQVDDHVIHLLFSANRWELDESIRHTINKGTTVVIDRYAYSGMAYSSAKRTLSMDWCRNTERGLPKPDLVIYLELPKESQYQRQGFGEERFETREFQELIRQQYEQVISASQETWLRIDVANKSPDEVLGEIIIPVKRCIESSANKDLEDIV